MGSKHGTPAERFWRHVDLDGEGGCWLWTATTLAKGYGRFYPIGNRGVLAHRWAYEHLVGPIPEGLQIDHLCRVTACVNPDHLEPVTNRENALRGNGVSGSNARKTHCVHGHPLDEENTYVNARGVRRCRVCRAATSRAHHLRARGCGG